MDRAFTTKHTKATKFKIKCSILPDFFVYFAIFVVKMCSLRFVRF